MVKILVANQNVEQNTKLCQYLANDNNLKIIGTNDGISTLEQYHKIRPDIFILDTNLKDINYIDIIDKLSYDMNEKMNCNTILVSSIPNESLCITNTAKLYKTFSDQFDFQDVSKTILEMSNYILDKKIDRLFLKLKIPLRSNPSNRVRNALTKCYYCPELLENLNELFDLVGKDFKTTREGIRSSFRTALKPLNLYKDKEQSPFAIYKLFEKGEEVTPKRFLEISIYYLQNTKK